MIFFSHINFHYNRVTESRSQETWSLYKDFCSALRKKLQHLFHTFVAPASFYYCQLLRTKSCNSAQSLLIKSLRAEFSSTQSGCSLISWAKTFFCEELNGKKASSEVNMGVLRWSNMILVKEDTALGKVRVENCSYFKTFGGQVGCCRDWKMLSISHHRPLLCSQWKFASVLEAEHSSCQKLTKNKS